MQKKLSSVYLFNSNMAQNDIERFNICSKEEKRDNWSSEEQIVLIGEVLKYKDNFFGKMKGAGAKEKHGKINEEIW